MNNRSQDYRDHFWDELFTEDPVESRLAREREQRRQRNGISLCSDADTLAAMAGTIAAAYYEYMPHLWQMFDHTPTDILDALSICSHKLSEMQ